MSRRVVQWATGPVGRHAIAAVCADPSLELIGCYVYDEEKAGRDAGALAGIGEAGVLATRDRDTILGLDADCVLYMAQGDADPATALDNICALLRSGKNVISTAVTPLIYPASLGQEVVDRLEAACSEGRTSFHGTGIEPGWAAEILPLTLSGLVRRLDHVLVQEIIDYSTYDNAFMLFDVMGFGRDPDGQDFLGSDPAVLGSVFRAPIMLLAEALGAEVEDWRFVRDAWAAPEAFDIPAGRIEAGRTAALRFGASGLIGSRPVFSIEHVTRVHEDAAPDWPRERGWRVQVSGAPSMLLEAKVAVNGEDENDQACLGTAMHAVHAIEPVCAAAPGIRTFLDLPMITGRGIVTGSR